MSLSKLYYDLNQPSSYTGVRHLYEAGGKKLTLAKIKHWLSKQDAYTRHRRVRHKFPRLKTIVGGLGAQWQCDLVDLLSLKKYNDGYRYILTCLDVFSRKLFVEILKTKSEKDMVAAFERLFKRTEPPKSCQTDKGLEFTSKIVQKVFKRNNVHFFTTQNENIKSSLVERVHRTILERVHRYFTRKGTYKYIDVLPRIVDNYNNTKHSAIGAAPNSVTFKNQAKLWRHLYADDLAALRKTVAKKRKAKLVVGDEVKITIAKTAFTKGYRGSWSDEIFTVKTVNVPKSAPITYTIQDYNEEPILGRFYDFELQKVVKKEGNGFYSVDQILKTRGKGVNKQHYVSWRGYGPAFNSWIQASDLKKL